MVGFTFMLNVFRSENFTENHETKLISVFFLQPLPGVALDDDENQEAIFRMGFIYLVMFFYV